MKTKDLWIIWRELSAPMRRQLKSFTRYTTPTKGKKEPVSLGTAKALERRGLAVKVTSIHWRITQLGRDVINAAGLDASGY